MAVYKKGNQITPMPSSIGNKIPTIGTTRTIMPSSATSLTSGQSGIGQMQGSFDRMFGVGDGPSSMGSLEAASMRLADAASRRSIDESEAQANIEARKMGYSSLSDQEYKTKRGIEDAERKRKQQEEDEEKMARGMIKIGGRWVTPVRNK